ncbi:MAG: HD domain-containing protein, partial [Eubacterium sp.]
EGFRLGAKDFISKPFDNIVMLSRIRAQMELYEYQTDLEKIVQEKTGKIEDLQQVITMSWAEAIESRDGTTGSHVRNTTRYFEAFLRILGQKESYKAAFLEETRSDMLKASAMHDVGKIGISDMVLKKPGPLTIEEYERMKEHSEIGAEMIRKLIGTAHPDRFLLYALDMARYHHEHWDGTGYPCRLEKNEIPLYVQVLSIVDVFDALTAVRPYKRAFTLEEALEIMQKDRGKFFSPELFDIFYENREIMKQVLETKES